MDARGPEPSITILVRKFPCNLQESSRLALYPVILGSASVNAPLWYRVCRFPTYFTVTKCCNSTTQFPEFRVTYSVFFGKDGYIITGHA